MDLLPFYTGPWRYSRRHALLYRFGDLKAWPGPWRLYAVKTALATLAVVGPVGLLLGVRGGFVGFVWYAGVPGCLAWLSCQEVRDGKLAHEFAASWLAQRLRRVGFGPLPVVRVRAPRRVRVSVNPWTKEPR